MDKKRCFEGNFWNVLNLTDNGYRCFDYKPYFGYFSGQIRQSNNLTRCFDGYLRVDLDNVN